MTMVLDGDGLVSYGVPNTATLKAATGSSVDFTIPAGVTPRRITLLVSGVSLSSTGQLLVQLGTAGGIVNTGYVSTGGYMYAAGGTGITSSTAGFCLTGGSTSAYTWSGVVTIATLGSNNWVSGGNLGNSASTASVFSSGGQLSNAGGAITTLRITNTSTDTFDAGNFNILYE